MSITYRIRFRLNVIMLAAVLLVALGEMENLASNFGAPDAPGSAPAFPRTVVLPSTTNSGTISITYLAGNNYVTGEEFVMPPPNSPMPPSWSKR